MATKQETVDLAQRLVNVHFKHKHGIVSDLDLSKEVKSIEETANLIGTSPLTVFNTAQSMQPTVKKD